MPIDSDEAVFRLASLNSSLADAIAALRAEWEPENPPITLAMSTLGRVIASRYHEWTALDRNNVLDVVELLLKEGNDSAKDAVATGLLEALLGASSAGQFSFAAIAEYLGPETSRYCKEWDKFTGCKTPHPQKPRVHLIQGFFLS